MEEPIEYIRVIEDPFNLHPARGVTTHEKWSMANRVFKCKYLKPVEEEIVSMLDGSCSKHLCYIIDRDEFLRVCPYLEGVKTQTFAIPVEFAVPWKPEGRINPETGKGCGLEAEVQRSKGWADLGREKGFTSPFSRRR